MTDINREVESIMSRGFSRDHAVKIFFANHSDLQFDPNASYNFDSPPPQQMPVNGTTPEYLESRSNGHSNGSNSNGRPQFQQPRSLAPLNGAQPAQPAQPSPPAGLQKMNSLSLNSTQQTATVTTTTTTSQLLAALSKSEDEEEATAPARTLTRLASVSAMPLSDEDEAQIQILIGQGYPRVVATQMYRQKGSLGGLNKKVLQSNFNLNELLAVPQTSNTEGPISLADYGIDPNSREGQQIISTTPVPVPINDSTPRQLGSRRPSMVSGAGGGDVSPYTTGGSAGTSGKYGAGPPSLEQPPRRPSVYGMGESSPQTFTPPVSSAGTSGRYALDRKPSTISVNNSEVIQVQAQEMRRVGSFTNGSNNTSGNLSPEERENEIQVLIRAGYSRPVATEMVRQRKTGGGLDDNIIEADIATHNYVAEVNQYPPEPLRRKDSYTPPPPPNPVASQEMRRVGSFTQNSSNGSGSTTPAEERENEIQVFIHAGYSRAVAMDMVRQRREGGGGGDGGNIVLERKSSGASNLARMAVENSYYQQQQQQQQQQQEFTKPVTRKSSSGTLSHVSQEDQEREEDQRQIELMISRGYTEEQARRATSLRRDQLRQQAVETRTLESRTRSSNSMLPRQTSSSSTGPEPSPRGEREYSMPVREYSMPTRTLPNNTSQSSMSLTGGQDHVRRNSSRSNDDLSYEDQAEIGEYMRQGFTEEQAVAMCRHQKSRQSQQNNSSFYSQSSFSQTSYRESRDNSGYRDSPPANSGNARHMLQRTGSITVPPSDSRNSRSSSLSNTNNLNADDEALRIGLLISEQDAEFGTNMYETITVQDEPEILRLVNMGYTTDDAVYLIFQRTYRTRNPNPYVPVPTVGSPNHRRAEINTNSREYSNSNGYNSGSGNNSPSPDRESSQQHKKGFFHRPSFLKKLSGSGKDWNDNKPRDSPHKSSSSKHHNHHHHNQHQQQHQREWDERESQNRYNEYTETPEEREMRLRLRYNERDVERLTELSFTREQAIQALVENHNNYERALTMLLRS